MLNKCSCEYKIDIFPYRKYYSLEITFSILISYVTFDFTTLNITLEK